MRPPYKTTHDGTSDGRYDRVSLGRTRGRTIGQTTHGQGGSSISEYIKKLKHMVPTIRTDEKLDEFEVLQRVIEYIQMLEEALGIAAKPMGATIPYREKQMRK